MKVYLLVFITGSIIGIFLGLTVYPKITANREVIAESIKTMSMVVQVIDDLEQRIEKLEKDNEDTK